LARPLGPEISIHLEAYGAVYVEIPKVACTSIQSSLAALLGIPLENGNPHITQFPFLEPQLASARWYPDQFSFAFVRNPWDRLVSCYRDKILGEVNGFTNFTDRPGVANCLAGFDEFTPGMTFDSFARAVCSIPDQDADPHFRSQHTFVAGASADVSKRFALNFVGRYESLAADLKQVESLSGLPDFALLRLQAATSRKRYQGFYTNHSLLEAVTKRFAADIELFRYEF
jgi:hypothetical protein